MGIFSRGPKIVLEFGPRNGIITHSRHAILYRIALPHSDSPECTGFCYI
jgi:hypothetical protein